MNLKLISLAKTNPFFFFSSSCQSSFFLGVWLCHHCQTRWTWTLDHWDIHISCVDFLGKYSMSDCCWSGQVWCRCMASFTSLPTLYTTRWLFFLSFCGLPFFFSPGKKLLNNIVLGLQKDTGDARAFSFLQILELMPFLVRPPSMLFVENVVGFEVCPVWLNSLATTPN